MITLSGGTLQGSRAQKVPTTRIESSKSPSGGRASIPLRIFSAARRSPQAKSLSLLVYVGGIVTLRRHNCRSSTALFMADREVKVDLDEVAGLWTIVTRLRCQRAAPNRSPHDGCEA
jgi:hypothetical protein